MPGKIAEIFGKYLVTMRPQLSHQQLPMHHLRLLADAIRKDPAAPAELRDLPARVDRIEADLRQQLALGIRAHQAEENRLRGEFSAVAQICLRALQDGWNQQSVDDAYGGAYGDQSPSLAQAIAAVAKPPESKPEEPAWRILAETAAATQVVVYLSPFFVQLRNLVWGVLLTSSLLLVAATSYPFHPEKLLLFCLLGLIGASLVTVLYVMVDANRDEVMSRIAKTTPGKFSLDSGFVGSFLTYIVPTVGLLAAQLSGSFRWMMEPILRVLK